MTLQQASSLPPNNAVDKRNLFHSRKRLQYLTKAAVDKAYKLNVESRRLVHIVDMQSCGSSRGRGLSNPFSCRSSALVKKPSPSSPSPSRQWALSKGSNDRRTIATRIHALLLEWKADSSSKWRARVASAVPILEEAMYKEAKSREEYTNPQLLESQLMHVLCHFEAGNGPFLLQGSTPLYSVRASSPSSVPPLRMSLFHQNTVGHGLSTNEEIGKLASEQTFQRARRSCAGSSAIGESVNLGQAGSHNLGGHASNGLVNKVAIMLANKKRREKSVCLKSELGKADSGLERVEDVAEDGEGMVNASNGMSDPSPPEHTSLRTREERRRTLGGMLQLNMFHESTSQGFPAINAEEAFAISRTDKESSSVENPASTLNSCAETYNETIHKFPVDVMDSNGIPDSGSAEEEISSSSFLPVSDDDEGSNASATTSVVPECDETTEQLTDQEHGAHCGRRSFNSPSSSSCTPSSSSSFARSSSAFTPLVSTSASPSFLLNQFSVCPSPLLSLLPSSSPPLASSASSSSPQQVHGYTAYSTSLPHRESQKLVPSLTAAFKEMQHSQPQTAGERHIYNALNTRPQSLHPAMGSRTQVESHHSATQTASEQRTEADRGSLSLSSSPPTSNGVSSKTRERGIKLPLRRFLAEREEYMGRFSKYVDGGCPWDTWEEATEQLDGMCCVCMVGLKGAAFIPCGHTFCRKCSRELWRGRGTCPLCNRYIREILDIY